MANGDLSNVADGDPSLVTEGDLMRLALILGDTRVMFSSGDLTNCM